MLGVGVGAPLGSGEGSGVSLGIGVGDGEIDGEGDGDGDGDTDAVGIGAGVAGGCCAVTGDGPSASSATVNPRPAKSNFPIDYLMVIGTDVRTASPRVFRAITSILYVRCRKNGRYGTR
jgi:hypothetical protein